MGVNRLESAERVDAAVGLRPGLAEPRIGIRTSLDVLRNARQFGTRRSQHSEALFARFLQTRTLVGG